MSESTLRIGLILPQVLGTYGDGGNSAVLAARALWRGLPAEIITLDLDQPLPTDLDIYTIGGGEDVAQVIAVEYLRRGDALRKVVEAQKPVLAICAGLQILGHYFIDARGEKSAGLGLIDAITLPQGRRSIGELVIKPQVIGLQGLLTGFENHGGATLLGRYAKPLGATRFGSGNGVADLSKYPGLAGGEYIERDEAGTITLVEHEGRPFRTCQPGADGVVQGSVICTYLHGPVLARNPELADLLLARALGRTVGELPELQIPALKPLPAAPSSQTQLFKTLTEVPGLTQLRAQRLAAAGLHEEFLPQK